MRPSLHCIRALFGIFFACSAHAQDSKNPRAEALQKSLTEITAALVATPDSIGLYSRRGDCHLFLGQFSAAVADFEKMIALDPAQDAPHWRLGIAYYFARDFSKASRQFEKYHAYDGHDRENGIWKFLSDASQADLPTARAAMLVYRAFDREPFPLLYEMFAGRATPTTVLDHIEAKQLGDKPGVRFFAHYYIGLQEELLGHQEAAQGHLGKAVAVYVDLTAAGGNGYMWQVAGLHADRLATALNR